jgi:gliding motility-associated-like protein
MIKRFRHTGILILLLLATQMAAQLPVLDSICSGAERFYRVDGKPGSTYSWILTHPDSNTELLLSNADTIQIFWNYLPGIYAFEVIQHSEHGCDADPVSGYIIILEPPDVYAGHDDLLCAEGFYHLVNAMEEFASSVLWTSSGDGTFANELAVITTYYPGENDIITGQVTLTLTAFGFENCGEATDEINLTIIPEVYTFAGNDNTICEDAVIQLSAQANNYSELEWSSSGTGSFSNPSILNPVYTPGIEDIYAGSVILSLTAYSHAPGSCPHVVSELVLTISSPLIADIATTPSLDNNPVGTAHLTITAGTPPYMYSLDGVNWQHEPSFTGLSAGTFTAWVRDANGCIDTRDFIILNLVLGEVEVIAGVINSCTHIVFDVPVMASGFLNIAMFNLKLDFDLEIIQLHTLIDINPALLSGLLSFTQPNPGSVVIEFSSGIPVTIPSDENLFKLEFTGIEAGQSNLQWDRPECYFFASSGYAVPSIYITGLVEIHSTPQIVVEGEGDYCEGDNLSLNALSLNQQNLTYHWTGPDGSSFDGATWNLGLLNLNHSGNFTLTAITDRGCDTIIDVYAMVNELPEVHLALNDTSCLDDQPIWLEPGIWYASYSWQDGSTAANYLVTKHGEYWVEVTDENGCKNLAMVNIIPCDIELLIPTAFSPDGDGLNDVFGPLVPAVQLSDYSLLIYNRWGQLIFESKDISQGWDGRINDQPAPMDVYSYVIIYSLPDFYTDRVPRQMIGSLMLLR